MNKKFSTLVASLLLTSAFTVSAQRINYDAQGHSIFGGVTSTSVDPRFEHTSYLATTAPTETIKELKNIDKGAEDQYFQFGIQNGQYLLAMQWDEAVKKYQLVFVDATDATNRSFVDETLWEVQAMYVGASKDLRYVLVNKASQLPLQVPNTSNVNGANAAPLYVEGNVITWSWSPVAKNTAGLSGKLVAAIDENKSIAITTADALGATSVDRANWSGGTPSNEGMAATKVITNGTAASDAAILEVSAYVAQPVSLTASQINSMMTGSASQAPVNFIMSPNEVVGSAYGNPLTAQKFTAYTSDDTNPQSEWVYLSTKEAKDAAKKFESVLYVDTAYHNASLDARYELKLKVGEIGKEVLPREIFVLETEAGIHDNKLADKVVASLKEQAKFRVKYYPSDRKVLVQSKGYVYAEKSNKSSWWQALLLAHQSETFSSTINDAQLTAGDIDATATSSSTVIASIQNVDWNHYQPADTKTEVDLIEPAFTAERNVTNAAEQYIWSSYSTLPSGEWNRNLIKLTTLTTSPEHTELTVGYDSNDADYDGIKTNIFIGSVAKKEAAYINSGFYYIQNANEVSTLLLKSGQWRYEDLAATNFTGTHYDKTKDAWTVQKNDDVETPHVVYSDEQLKEIPAAQWYIDGQAGFYSITNRESANPGKYTYLWKVQKDGAIVPNTYACLGTYADGTSFNDTIKIEPVTAKMQNGEGYLNLSNEEALKETNVFNFAFSTVSGDTLYIAKNANDQLLINQADKALEFKVEKVLLKEKDTYTGNDVTYDKDSLIYGLDNLKRNLYYVYVENVSSNTTEPTGKKTRTYITLDGGVYKLTDVEVSVDKNGFATPTDEYLKANGNKDPRNQFYVKNISNNPAEFVFVDPFTKNADNFDGVRIFANQVNGMLQPAGVISQGASNVFDNSVFAFDKVTKYNYRDIRKEGAVRDTVVFHKESNDKIMLFEGHAEGANIGLLDRVNDAQLQKNYAMFIDTANVADPAKPMFLIGLRNKDTNEHGSNIEEHNKHLYTTADYLMVLTDSAKVNPAYKDFQGKVRLGFVNAKHEGTTLSLTNDDKKFDLSKGMCPAVFAFRYVDTNRDAFYIETQDVDGTTVWVKTINEVPVIVNNIKDAEVFNVKSTTEAPTANDEVSAEAGVSVVAANGAIIIKNAAGKKVAISNILGKAIANETIASDNETIAVPAGIVVVAVEGEEAVKTVVK